MPIRCLVTDLDGTLLDRDKNLPAGAESFFQELSRCGVHIVVATARPPRSARRFHTALSSCRPLICYNGAGVYDYTTESFLQHHGMDRKLADEVCRMVLEFDGLTSISFEVMDRGFFMPCETGADPRVTGTAQDGFLPEPIESLEAVSGRFITKIMPYLPAGGVGRMYAHVRECFGDRLSVFYNDDHLLEICTAGVDKAVSLQRLLESWGIGWDHVAAAGDNLNDLEMLRRAAFAVATTDSPEVVRSVADVVAVDPAGVIRALEELVKG
jgi:hypothetical protein